MSENNADRVKKIIVSQLNVSEEQVSPEASFIDDLGADSLDQVELVMALEEEFDTDIPEEEAEKLQTVGSVIQYVEANLSSNSILNSGSGWESHSLIKFQVDMNQVVVTGMGVLTRSEPEWTNIGLDCLPESAA